MHAFKCEQSSSVDFVVFDDRSHKMFVRYASGPRIYVASNATLMDYEGIRHADSAGKALGEFFRKQKETNAAVPLFKLTEAEEAAVLSAVEALCGDGSDVERRVAAWQLSQAVWF